MVASVTERNGKTRAAQGAFVCKMPSSARNCPEKWVPKSQPRRFAFAPDPPPAVVCLHVSSTSRLETLAPAPRAGLLSRPPGDWSTEPRGSPWPTPGMSSGAFSGTNTSPWPPRWGLSVRRVILAVTLDLSMITETWKFGSRIDAVSNPDASSQVFAP